MPIASFSGLASGIDSDALIKATLDAKRLRMAPLERQLDAAENETTALEEFNTKLLNLRDALGGFMTIRGGGIKKTGSSSAPDYIGVSAQAGTLNTNTNVEVLKLAKAATLSFEDRFTSYDKAIFPGLSQATEIQVDIGSGDKLKTYSLSVDSTTTLGDLASKVSELAPDDLRANVINSGTSANPEYLLMLNSTKSGIESGTLAVRIPETITSQGIFTQQSLSQASDAELVVDGVGHVTRATNTISDLLPGITLELKAATLGPVSISVTDDPSSTADSVEKLVDALNEVITFSKENNSVERIENEAGVTNLFGSLAKTNVDDRAISQLRSALAAPVAAGGENSSTFRVLSEIGITIERDGSYKFSRDEFEKAMARDANTVNSLLTSFADSAGKTNGIIDQYTRFQGQVGLAIANNDEQNERLNKRLAEFERQLSEQEEMLKLSYSRLEATMSRLQSGQTALTSALASLGSLSS